MVYLGAFMELKVNGIYKCIWRGDKVNGIFTNVITKVTPDDIEGYCVSSTNPDYKISERLLHWDPSSFKESRDIITYIGQVEDFPELFI